MTKRQTLLQLMLTLALSPVALHFVTAQSDYRPMLELTRFRWINGWYDNNMGKELNYLYDTTVENRQLKVYRFDHEGWSFQNSLYYFREDVQEKKVWQCYTGNDTIPYAEYLLYDFSLQTGDTLDIDYQDPEHFKLIYVHHVDTIQLLDGPYRRIAVYRWWEGSTYPSLNGNQPYYDLVEGVGNLYMPFYSEAQAWDMFTPICAWRGDIPVTGDCEIAQINCDALQIDSLSFESPGTFYLQMSYGQADWPIHASKLMILSEQGDTLAFSNYSSGNLLPNETIEGWIWTEDIIPVLPDLVRVIVIDQLTQQQCEILFGTTGLDDTPGRELLRVYPNPAAGEFQVELPAGFEVAGILLFDAQGRRYAVEANKDAASLRIVVGNIPPGMYSLTLLAADGSSRIARVAIAR
ncbi:MAG: T9SS type A sorting domain-containing protein [Saprospiraceae bacterium]|nr:T9SS type A sorting domain-containing protein [Saprospiraceae bacterium]